MYQNSLKAFLCRSTSFNDQCISFENVGSYRLAFDRHVSSKGGGINGMMVESTGKGPCGL